MLAHSRHYALTAIWIQLKACSVTDNRRAFSKFTLIVKNPRPLSVNTLRKAFIIVIEERYKFSPGFSQYLV